MNTTMHLTEIYKIEVYKKKTNLMNLNFIVQIDCKNFCINKCKKKKNVNTNI